MRSYKKALWLLCVVPGLWVLPTGAAEKLSTGDEKTDAVMVAIQKRLKEVKTCSARVVTVLRAMDQTFEITGDGVFQVPDRLRLSLMLPGNVRQTVVSDGGHLWTYNTEEGVVVRINRVKVYRATGREPDADQPDPLRPFRGLEWETIRYVDSEALGEENVRVFEATPEPSLLQIDLPGDPSRVRVYVHPDDGLVRQVRLFGASGEELMTQRFHDVVVNPELEKEVFEFVVPAGAHVIDMTEDAIELLKR